MKRILLAFSLCLALTSCADRVRYNCDTKPANHNGITERRC
jgi:hypothetical protein